MEEGHDMIDLIYSLKDPSHYRGRMGNDQEKVLR
jgi:hypothetical protein